MAQGEDVAGGGSAAFRWNVPLGPHLAHGSESAREVGHQPRVRQLGPTSDKNHIGRLDIAMNEAPVVKELERVAERQAQPGRLSSINEWAPPQVAAEVPWHVTV